VSISIAALIDCYAPVSFPEDASLLQIGPAGRSRADTGHNEACALPASTAEIPRRGAGRISRWRSSAGFPADHDVHYWTCYPRSTPDGWQTNYPLAVIPLVGFQCNTNSMPAPSYGQLSRQSIIFADAHEPSSCGMRQYSMFR